MKSLWLTGGMLVALVSSAVDAQALADLRGEVVLPEGPTVHPGTIARVVLTATNYGPDATSRPPGVGAVFVPNVGFRNFDLLALPETAPCTVRYIDFVAPPGQLSTVGVTISTERVLEPAESATCVVGLRTFPESPAEQLITFGFGPLVGDPDPDNNTVAVTVRTGVPPVVARPISIPSTSLLPLLFLIFGVVASSVASLRRLP